MRKKKIAKILEDPSYFLFQSLSLVISPKVTVTLTFNTNLHLPIFFNTIETEDTVYIFILLTFLAQD